MQNEVIDFCGTAIKFKTEMVSIRKVLWEQANVYSCGGVFLSQGRDLKKERASFSFLNLTNYHHDIIVLNHLSLHRLPGNQEEWGRVKHARRLSPKESFTRFIKASVN